MDVQAMYQDIILDHYREKHHSGLRQPYDAEVHHVNPSCGDELTLRVHVDDGKVADESYQAQGCSISQASASILSDLAIGRPIDDTLALYDDFVAMMEAQGVGTPDEDRLEDAIAFEGVAQFPGRVKCAMLAWSALRDALLRSGAVGRPVENVNEETQ
ncbi:MAG: SUF system NifU family Fe-S cluster assembly protein [Propionibacteriaceae bacterium]|nr:SUF system NifU family Fe-S cluster assembly protein [Propionibacteriaceae bacterium]